MREGLTDLGSFAILGSLQVTAESTGKLIDLPPKPRILLARLLLSANRIVPLRLSHGFRGVVC